MNEALDRLARQLDLADASREPMRLAFGHACVARVAHLLESAEVVACLQALRAHVDGAMDRPAFMPYVHQAAGLALSHPGSRSLDGCGHAAVSASYAVARALEGRALVAAEYAAYATVYGQGGSGAVADRDSFTPEFEWQVRTLGELAAVDVERSAASSTTR